MSTRAERTNMPSNKKNTKHLKRAAESLTLVRVHRSPRNADRVDGFVLEVGRKWVLIADTRDGGFFDGLVAVRLKHVVSVEQDVTFASRFSRTQPEWPPTASAPFDLDTTQGLLRDLSRLSPVIAIEQEGRFDTAMMWVGKVTEISDGRLWLLEVRPNAKWRKRERGYRLKRITKASVGDEYLTALTTVAARVGK